MPKDHYIFDLCLQYPLLLLPVFPRFHEMCRAALARPDLSAVESVTLQEALLLVSNHLCCYERQSALVAQVTVIFISFSVGS